MEDSSTRSYKMGKYTQVNCRQCRSANMSSNQHVRPRRNSREGKYSDPHDCVNLLHQERAPTKDIRDASELITSSASNLHLYSAQESCANSVQDPCINCANRARELWTPQTASHKFWRPVKKTKKLRNRRTTSPRPLSRSSSCSSLRYAEYGSQEAFASSETDSECSDVFETLSNVSASSCQACCNNDVKSKALERPREVSSMPNLMNGMYTAGNCKSNNQDGVTVFSGNNHLGLEVMLSLINGPMQSVIDSKDEKIKSLESVIERLECENKQIKFNRLPGDATKIFTLEKTLENYVRQIEQLEETNKTAQEKVRLLEDLRKNDKECIDILRAQTSDLETKLTKSDERVREAEKEGRHGSV